MHTEKHERRRVTRAIKLALARIAEQDPELALLLGQTIKTGEYLSYSPVSPRPDLRRKRVSEREKAAPPRRKSPTRH
jgi:hypothetical protein